jgi:hypothetical protein
MPKLSENQVAMLGKRNASWRAGYRAAQEEIHSRNGQIVGDCPHCARLVAELLKVKNERADQQLS